MDVSQYLDIFIDESSEHIQTLSDCIMTLEQEPENKDTINEIFRAAHSLKGMAGTMGFKRMQHLTHDMENVFQEIRSGNMKVQPELIDVLFRGLDALEGYLANILESADEGTEDNEEIINTLNSIADKAKGGTGEVPVPTPTAAPSDDKSAASDGNKAKYENIRISDYEKATFEKAKEEIAENPNTIGLWQTLIAKYPGATIIHECENAIRWSNELMDKWIPKVYPNIDIEIIRDKFLNHKTTCSHARRLSKDDCKEVGLNIIDLEDFPSLNDAVLSLHSCYTIMIDKYSYSKIVENQNGETYFYRDPCNN